MTTTSTLRRAWRGPAVLSFGFRPFFLLGALWALVAMGLWIGMLSGRLNLPIAVDPVTWHAHAFLFGYLGAILAGFLLTAVPNWTGQLPVVGWRLGLLAVLWLIGRVAMVVSAHLPPVAAAALDLSCLVLLAGLLTREIIAGKNWRNLGVLALLAVLILGNALFHLEAASGGSPAQGDGLRLGLAAAVMMISLIGGRIVPSFTRNWLTRRGDPARPARPALRFDKLVMLATAAGLGAWVVRPLDGTTGALLLAVSVLQGMRLARWAGHRTLAEPLVWVLHLAYAFVPLGTAALGAAILRPDLIAPAAAQHLWTAGAIGMMTLAVMTRATLGHTGRPLTAGAGTTGLYLVFAGAVLARFMAGVVPGWAGGLYTLSGALWCAAFGGFVLLYGPFLMRPKAQR